VDERVLRVAVFDRNATECVRTAQALRGFFTDRGLQPEVSEFTTSDDFVCDCKNKYAAAEFYDFAFLVVDSMKGAETARQVRKIDETLPLFFIGQVSDFALDAFRLLALDFLTKPVSQRSVAEAFWRITNRRRAAHRIPDSLISLNESGGGISGR
jgi:FixJ family two-component response regulator